MARGQYSQGPRYGHHGGYLPREAPRYEYVPETSTDAVLRHTGLKSAWDNTKRYWKRGQYIPITAVAASTAWKHRKAINFAATAARRFRGQYVAYKTRQRLHNAQAEAGTPRRQPRTRLTYKDHNTPQTPRKSARLRNQRGEL